MIATAGRPDGRPASTAPRRGAALRWVAIAGAVAVLTVALVVLFVVAMTATGIGEHPVMTGETAVGAGAGEGSPGSAEPRAQGAEEAAPLLLVSFLQTVALSALVLRSRRRFWPLVATVFGAMVVVTQVLAHIDSLFFLEAFTPDLVARLVVAEVLIAAPFSVLLVLLLVRLRVDHTGAASLPTPDSTAGWAGLLGLLTALHVVLYFVAGYWIVWKTPEAVAFYGGVDPGSFWAQMASVVRDTPWLIPIQLVRGVLWGGVVVLVVRTVVGPRWSVAAIAAAVVVSLFALPLMIPNPFMPEVVRHAHLIETVVSRSAFALLAVPLVAAVGRSTAGAVR